ncbi:recombinase family protein [Bacillus tropicus]|uniref:recombinase family protein n=1 Tax=Bacillus tropicus TaxID=2026188 RepID=UPI003D229D22
MLHIFECQIHNIYISKKEIVTYCEANNIALLEECIFEEKQSGKNMRREQFQALVQQLNPGDPPIVYKLDRLGRNLSDMIRTHEKLIKNDIGVIAINDSIDTRKKDDISLRLVKQASYLQKPLFLVVV